MENDSTIGKLWYVYKIVILVVNEPFFIAFLAFFELLTRMNVLYQISSSLAFLYKMFILISITLFQSFNPVFPLSLTSKSLYDKVLASL